MSFLDNAIDGVIKTTKSKIDSSVNNIQSTADSDRLKLTKSKRSYAKYQYPQDLEYDGSQNVFLLQINVPEGSRFFAQDGGSVNSNNRPVVQSGNSLAAKSSLSVTYKRTTASIALYMPNAIAFVDSQDWQSKELGAISGFSNAASNISDSLNMEGVSSLGSFLKEGLQGGVASTIQQLSPLQVADLRNFSNAQVKNPYLEVLYNGTNNREFNYEFKFMPRNIDEANEVRNIVKTLRYHQAPEFKFAEDNLETYLLYPSTFDITFMHEGTENAFLHKVSTCALKSISVDYNSDGGFRTFKNGAPVQTNIQLSFTELEILTKNRIIKGGF